MSSSCQLVAQYNLEIIGRSRVQRVPINKQLVNVEVLAAVNMRSYL